GATGKGVLTELNRLRDTGWGTSRRPAVNAMLGGVQNYLWRRPDSMTGTLARQWQSSGETFGMIHNRLRDQMKTGAVIVRSEALLRELERVREDGDSFESEGKHPSGNRVAAAALAVESWASQLRPMFVRLQGRNGADTVIGRIVGEAFEQLRQQAPVGAR